MLTNSPPLSDRLSVQYEPLATEIAQSLHGLAEPVISDDADALVIGSKAADLVKLGKKVEKARKAEKDEFLAAGKTVDRFFSDMVVVLNAMVAAMTEEVRKHQARKLSEQRAADEAARKEAALFDEPAPVTFAPKAAGRIGDGEVKVAMRVDWKYEIVDSSKLARELLMPNDTAIKAAVAAAKAMGADMGDVIMPGVRLFEVVTPIYR